MSDSFSEMEQAIHDLGNKGNDYLSASRRDRPYDGQPQTGDGERGEQEVYGVTMRDVKDCFVIGAILASPTPCDQLMDYVLGKDIEPEYKKGAIYDLDWPNMDPLAVIQNAMCELEKRMGIYPNVPELQQSNEEGES